MLLTDGTIIIDDYCTSTGQWYKLTPDKKGSYVNGTWSAIAPMPSGYSPLSFAQQVLPDGRVIINGGEYNTPCTGGADFTNKGALYDPVSNNWTSVVAPSGWSTIGDAESIILPNGTYMLANCCAPTIGQTALASISGTSVRWTIQNTWKCRKHYPCMDEEGLTPLPNGDILLVDIIDRKSTTDKYWIYDPSTGTWTLGGYTASFLSDSDYEIGPAVLRPDGTVIQFGANGNNNLYNSASGKWSVTPDFPLIGQYDCADAPAALLPDGNVLVQASPGDFYAPSHFFEFSINTKGKQKLTQVDDPKQAGTTSSFEGNLLDLPTGQVLWDNSQATPHEVAVYTPKGTAQQNWLPVVSSVSSSLTAGSTGNAIAGTNFNGFSLGGSYGDDAQAATNFPLVRITNSGTGDVCFGRSYNFSTMGVFTSGTTDALFDIPSSCERGPSTLQVIVNGIASKGVSVKLT